MKNNQKVYLFHEINDIIIKKIEDISKENPEAIFTFDDGLYSNYLYFPRLKKLPNKKIFFIPSFFIRMSNISPSKDFITCDDAHKKGNPNLENYMSLYEILEIEEDKNCFIGAHGAFHTKYCLKEGIPTQPKFPEIIKEKAEKAIIKKFGKIPLYTTNISFYNKLFKDEIEKSIGMYEIIFDTFRDCSYFAWPYNIESKFMKKTMLKYNKNIIFFGNERIELKV